jgi:hypothetical protein
MEVPMNSMEVPVNSIANPCTPLPRASMPHASMPHASMPDASMPVASTPHASMPNVSVPVGAMPRGAMPRRAMPRGAMPRRASILRRATVTVAAVVAVTLLPAIAAADDATSAGRDAPAANGASRAPTVAEVIGAAYAASGLDRDPARSWIRRARLAGLVPWLTVQVGRDVRWDDGVSNAATSAITNVGHYDTVEVRATWRLDRLLFDGRELQVASIEAARRRERRRLASRVIRAYFTWRRAVTGTTGDPALDRDDGLLTGARVSAGLRATRADEATAELDALTDGWFSRELSGARRTASETRTDGGTP